MEKQEPNIELPLFFMKLRYWWYLSSFLQMFLLVFMISCLGSARWVRQGAKDTLNFWEGSLIEVTTGSSDFDDELYADLADKYCDGNGDTSQAWCSMFENLQEAAGSFIWFEFLTIVFTLVWMARVAMSLMGRGFIVDWMAYMWPWLGWFCHFLGVIIWSVVSDAKYSGDCDDIADGSDPAKVCATDGAGMAVTIVLFYAGIAGLYTFIYIRSKKLEQD